MHGVMGGIVVVRTATVATVRPVASMTPFGIEEEACILTRLVHRLGEMQ